MNFSTAILSSSLLAYGANAAKEAFDAHRMALESILDKAQTPNYYGPTPHYAAPHHAPVYTAPHYDPVYAAPYHYDNKTHEEADNQSRSRYPPHGSGSPYDYHRAQNYIHEQPTQTGAWMPR